MYMKYYHKYKQHKEKVIQVVIFRQKTCQISLFCIFVKMAKNYW